MRGDWGAMGSYSGRKAFWPCYSIARCPPAASAALEGVLRERGYRGVMERCVGGNMGEDKGVVGRSGKENRHSFGRWCGERQTWRGSGCSRGLCERQQAFSWEGVEGGGGTHLLHSSVI